MNLPYDPLQPLSIFITRLEDGINLAEAAGTLYSTHQIVQKIFNLISKAQCFQTGVREWRRKPSADKTWAAFKTHFGCKSKKYRKDNLNTAHSSVYQVANTSNQALLEVQKEFKQVTDSLITDFKKTIEQPTLPDPYLSKCAPVLQQAEYTSNAQNIHAIIKELREQNSMLMKTI